MTNKPDDTRTGKTDAVDEAQTKPRHPIIPLTLDRRTFVRGGSASVASAALGSTLAGNTVWGQDEPADPIVQIDAGEYATVMDRPEKTPSPDLLQSLTPHEAETVDAITSRLIPGTPDDPGAHEAGVVTYIDTLLAFNQGYAEFTYLQGPWAQTSTAASASSATPMASPGATPMARNGATPMASPGATPMARNGGGAKTVDIKAGEFYYDPSTFDVSPGDTLSMTNAGTVHHDMAVQEWDNKVIIPVIDPGDSAQYTIPDDAEVGSSLTVFCTIPGHREAGMVGTMRIVAAGSQAQATPQASPGATPGTGSGSALSTNYDVIMIEPDQIQRYGYQSRLSPRDVYRIGVSALDRYATQHYERPYKELDAKQQDQIVGDMAEGKIDSFDPALTAQSFFQNLRRHTAEGMFSDPAYGGNRNMVGWKLVGYPGAQRAYMPAEFQTEGTDRQPQSMMNLNHFHPGENRDDHDNVILPVSSSDEKYDHDSEP